MRENENALRAVGAEERGEASQVCRSTRRSRDQPSASTWFKERSVTGGGALLHSSPPDGERVAAVPHEIAQAHERRRGEHSHDPGAHAPAVRPLADDSENLQRQRRDRRKNVSERLKRSGFLPRRARSSRCIKCISSARSFVRCVGLDMGDWSADQSKPNSGVITSEQPFVL